MDAAIKIENLTKKFGSFTAVNNISLEIAAGEIFAFLGPNGAGKTTTVKLMAGLLRQTSGNIFIGGYDMRKDLIPAKKIIGLLPDTPFLYPKLTGIEFLQFMGNIYGVSREEQKKRVPELIAMFDLHDYAAELIETYSHGTRQKLVFAGILLRSPKVLLLDEPLVGLDPKSARLVKDIFTGLVKRGVTIFMCTHILEIAEKIADRIGIIHKGEMILLSGREELRAKASGTLEDLYLQLTGGTAYAEMLKYL